LNKKKKKIKRIKKEDEFSNNNLRR